MRALIFDTETTGLPRDKNMPAHLLQGNWPDLVSIAWKVYENGVFIREQSFLIQPEGWTIPPEATKIHGITQEKAQSGVPLKVAMEAFCRDISSSGKIIAHNLAFDKQVVLNALRWRLSLPSVAWSPLADICTGILSTKELKLPFNGNTHAFNFNYKMPSLKELYVATFHTEDPPGAHDSLRDVHVLEQIILTRWPNLLE